MWVKVVKPASSIIGVPGERLRPMNDDDHISICRFATRDDDRYKLVLKVLQDFAKAALPSQ